MHEHDPSDVQLRKEKARALLGLHRRPRRSARTYMLIAFVAAALTLWFATSRRRRRRARAIVAGSIAIASLALYLRASARERHEREVDRR